jgi:P pilus assembly chaperone PapD
VRRVFEYEVNMTRSILTLAALVGIAWPLSSATADTSLDVSPIRVTVRMNADEEYTNSLRVLNSGDEPTRLRAYVEDWYLDEVGTPIFRHAGTLERTASLWIESAPNDFLLEPGQTEYVRFTIKVPKGVPEAGYHGTLILETLPLNRAEGGPMQMFVQGRIACMMYVTVGDPPKGAKITDLKTIQREGENLLRLQVANTGLDFIRLAGDLTIVEGDEVVGEGDQLPDVPVLPGARRWIELELSPDHMFSNYLARITLDIADVGILVGECPLDPEKVELIH